MRRAQFYSGVITLALVTLPLLTTGCTQSNYSAERSANAARDAADVGDGGLPEVVVTAKRPGAETIAMSDRDANVRRTQMLTPEVDVDSMRLQK